MDSKCSKETDRKSQTSPKPVVLVGALFMWERVASFCTPKMVCTLEHLCHDVHKALAASSKGSQLMQLYWNAQSYRLIWEGSEIPKSKRTLNFTLSRSEGKRNWKKVYREEYALWAARTFQGAGANNNAINTAKVLFKSKSMNDVLSGMELAKLQLTPEEALEKAARRNEEIVEGEEISGNHNKNNNSNNNNNNNNNNGDASPPPEKKRRKKKGRRREDKDGAAKEPMKDPALGLTRDDYWADRRLGKHKGKHQKGGVSRWSAFGGGQEEYD